MFIYIFMNGETHKLLGCHKFSMENEKLNFFNNT